MDGTTTEDGDGDARAVPARFDGHAALRLWLSARLADEGDPATVLRVTAEAVGRHLGVSEAGYGDIDLDAGTISIPLDWTDGKVPSQTGEWRFDLATETPRRYARGETVVVADVAAEPGFPPEQRAFLAAQRTAAFVGVPLFEDGRLAAMFAVNHCEPREWSAEEVALVNEVGARTAAAIHHLRATARLREREALFRALGENVPGLCWFGDADGRISWGNGHYRRFFAGIAVDGSHIAEVVHPDDLPQVRDAMAAAVDGAAAPIERTLRLRGATGGYRPFLCRSAPVHGADGRIVRWCGVAIDLTERQATERHQQFLRAFHDAARDLTDPAAILTLLGRMLADHLDVAQVAFTEILEPPAPVARIMTARHGVARLDADTLMDFGMPGFESFLALYRAGRTIVVEDMGRDQPGMTDAVRAMAVATGVNAGINVPVIKDGVLVASFSAMDERPRVWTPDEIALCEELAERAWATMSRARVETALKERERHQRFLNRWNDRLRGETDPATIVASTLEMLARFLGTGRANFAEADGADRFTVLSEWRDDGTPSGMVSARPGVSEGVHDAYLAGEVVAIADIAADPRFDPVARGAYAAVEATAFLAVPLVRRGQVRAVLSVQQGSPRRWDEAEIRLARDVAERMWVALERARAEAALHARERDQAFLLDWSDQARPLATPEAILDLTLDRLRTHFAVARANYAESDPSGEVFTIRAESCGEAGLPILGGSYPLSEVGEAVNSTFLGGEMFVCVDAGSDPRIGDKRRLYKATGAIAIMSVPLIRDGRVIAVLSIQQPTPRHWTEIEAQLIRDVADRTWAALERARAEASLKERERAQAFLIDWSDRLRPLASPDAILAATLDAVRGHLDVSRATYTEGAPEEGSFVIVAESVASGVSVAGQRFDFADAGEQVHAIYADGGMFVCEDAATDPRVQDRRDLYLAMDSVAQIGVPLVRDGRVVAFLSVQHREPRRWNAVDAQLLRDVADRTWAELERARAEAALKERERAQAFLLDWNDRVRPLAAADAIVATTLERLRTHLGASRALFAEAGETTAEDFLVLHEATDAQGDGIAGISYPLADLGEAVRSALLSGAMVVSDDVAADERVGSARPLYAAAGVGAVMSVPLVRDGRVRALMTLHQRSARDWTAIERQLLRDLADRCWAALERARAEAALKERERAQAFLLAWNDEIRNEASPRAILEVTLERLGREIGVSRLNYGETDSAGLGFDVLHEWRDDGSSSVVGYHFAFAALGERVHAAHASGEPVVVDDIATSPLFDDTNRAMYDAIGLKALLGIPLVRGGRLEATLSLQQAEPRRWTPAEIRLVRDVADRTWAVLERARAEEALQERERAQAFLIDWSDRLRRGNGPQAMVETTLAMLGEYLRVSRVGYGEFEGAGEAEVLHVLDEWQQGVVQIVGQRMPVATLGTTLIDWYRAGNILVADDIHDTPLIEPEVAAFYDTIGIRASITVPLLGDGRLAGVLSIHQDAPRRWTAAEIRLACEIADRVRDLLQRARSEERLAESEALLSAFMENAPLGMHIKDEDGRYIRLNPELADAIGRPVETLIGRTPAEILPPETAAALDEIERRARAGELASTEIATARRDRWRSLLAIAFPIKGKGRARTAGLAIDLTERKAAEDALARSRETLFQTEKLSALGSLLAGVSHELNNPLSIVVAQSVMMERQARGTEIAERAQKVRRAADRCARIVQTFLAMARQKRPERKPVDLNAVAAAALELTDYGLRNDGVAVARDLGAGLPLLSADADQLHQIIVNLLVNAQQAMAGVAPGHRHLSVRTARGPASGTLVLEVTDTGPGVPPEAQRRIFEPFYTTKPQGEGTGMGLSFSQGLAEAHGGRLELVSAAGAKGAGARFRLTLPIDPAVSLDREPSETVETVVAGTRRALIIDDEEEIAEALADFLSLEGFRCDVAGSGVEAKRRLHRGEYDLIVSDIRMPGVDGPQLHAWLLAERPDLAARVGFATGDTLGTVAARFLDEVRRPVLEKPFTPEAVHRFVTQMDLP